MASRTHRQTPLALAGAAHPSLHHAQLDLESGSYYLCGSNPSTAKIRVTPDNHSAHISKETRAYLASVPNRFEFVFTPKHGSRLNIVETFFAKMTNTFLRGIRVVSKQETR